MNICYCGYQPGDYAHRPACPYPLFRGNEAQERAWYEAEAVERDKLREAAGRPVTCERCRKGPHDDGYPPILTAAEAIDLGWTRTATGLLDEECASEVLANDGELMRLRGSA